mgnify:FL=1|jgi:hypothetical protein|tara:strand:- start:439 stop:1614 length:1176 start_codon:yes stop_codon:yes gene_type:complete
MAWTSKVANVIKGRIGSAIAGAVGNKLMNSFASQGQTTKVAAKLLGKSPLEIGNNSATAHMLENPYSYGTVYYPQETSNLGDGHYVIFDILAHKRSKFKMSTFDNGVVKPTNEGYVGEDWKMFGKRQGTQNDRIKNIKQKGIMQSNRVRGVNSGLFKHAESNHTYVTDSILLYMPPEGMKFNYSAEYEALETGIAGDLAQGLAGLVNADDFEGAIQSIGKGLSGVTELTKMAGFGALAIIPGMENARGLYDKFRGQAKNPNLESVFKSVPFREFNFPFTFAAKNEKEKDSVHKILQMFRFHMLPQHKNDANGYFDVPSEFQITYMYRDNENQYLPRISRCVLKTCEIDYAPEGVVSTLTPDERGAPPTIIKMNLQFGETEIMTKETVAQGY